MSTFALLKTAPQPTISPGCKQPGLLAELLDVLSAVDRGTWALVFESEDRKAVQRLRGRKELLQGRRSHGLELAVRSGELWARLAPPAPIIDTSPPDLAVARAAAVRLAAATARQAPTQPEPEPEPVWDPDADPTPDLDDLDALDPTSTPEVPTSTPEVAPSIDGMVALDDFVDKWKSVPMFDLGDRTRAVAKQLGITYAQGIRLRRMATRARLIRLDED